MTGGWDFVAAAYVVAYGALAAYGLNLLWKCRQLSVAQRKSVDL